MLLKPVYLTCVFLLSSLSACFVGLGQVNSIQVSKGVFANYDCTDANLDLVGKTSVNLGHLPSLWATIDRARIVAIGELSHLDGSTLALKAHLIEEIAHRYDSVIVVLEYGIATIDEIKRRVEEQGDTLEYHFGYLSPVVQGTTRGNHKLAVTLKKAKLERGDAFSYYGLDIQESVGYLDLYLRRVLPQDILIPRANGDPLDFDGVVKSFTKNWWWKPFKNKESEERFYDKINPELNRRLADTILHYVSLSEFDRRVFTSIRNYEEVKLQWTKNSSMRTKAFPEASILRDSIMAANLIWISEQHPNHKIIVSVSNFHAAKTLNGVYKKFVGNVRVMGDYCSSSLGDEFASIATIRYAGAAGLFRYTTPGKYRPVIKKSRNSLESQLSDRCHDVGFLSFKNISENVKFRLHATMAKEASFEWSRAYDGVIFIREMQTDISFSYLHRTATTFPE